MVTIADAERVGLSLSKVNPKGAVGYTVGYGKPPVEHQFEPGQGGRPRGSRNKLGEDFINALADDFAKHGAVAIERVSGRRNQTPISK